MENFIKLGFVNVEPLVQELEKREDLWNEFPDRMIGFNLMGEADFDDIWIHMPTSATTMDRDEIMANLSKVSHATRWHRGYFELPVKKMLSELFFHVDAEAFGRVFISRLQPGKHIFPHVDQDLQAFSRFHVAIQSAPGQVFKCDQEEFTPEAGQVFWFNNNKMHSVENNSEFARLTMVVDLITPYTADFLNGRIEDSQ